MPFSMKNLKKSTLIYVAKRHCADWTAYVMMGGFFL